nr:PREDICTED: uncharacterized protein LOC109037320 [Bemisia tabaci]
MVNKVCMQHPAQIFLRVSYALILIFLMIILADCARRVVVYLPPKKIKHYHHHHHHMVMLDPESKMVLPFAQLQHPLSPAKLQAAAPEDGNNHIVHPHVYKAGTPTAAAQNRDFQPPTLSLSRLLAHRPRDLLQPYVIPDLRSLVSAPTRARRYNFEPIATGPAQGKRNNIKNTEGI